MLMLKEGVRSKRLVQPFLFSSIGGIILYCFMHGMIYCEGNELQEKMQKLQTHDI